jgi:hypothetical protein
VFVMHKGKIRQLISYLMEVKESLRSE